MVTGYDNVIFSNAEPVRALRQFTRLLSTRWPHFLDETEWKNKLNHFTGKLDFFFCKDDEMLAYYEEHDYSINDQGEDCFSIYVNSIDYFGANIIVEKELKNSILENEGSLLNRDAYKANIVLNDIYEYTIVTPEDPKKNEFSNFLFSNLSNVLEGL